MVVSIAPSFGPYSAFKVGGPSGTLWAPGGRLLVTQIVTASYCLTLLVGRPE